MREIAYISRPQGLVFDDDILAILQVSRRNNARAGVTGALLYDAGRFFQIIEGPDAEVERLYRVICTDTRHTDVVMLANGSISERSFGRWSMTYRCIDRRLESLGLLSADGQPRPILDGTAGRRFARLLSDA